MLYLFYWDDIKEMSVVPDTILTEADAVTFATRYPNNIVMQITLADLTV